MTLLQVQNIQSAYQESQVLFGIDFTLKAGESMGLLGRNGMGNLSLFKAVKSFLMDKTSRIKRLTKLRAWALRLCPRVDRFFPTSPSTNT